MNHSEFLERVHDYIDGRADGGLDRDTSRRMEEHAAQCAGCRAELTALESLKDDARLLRARSVEPSRDLWPDIRARIAPTRFQESMRSLAIFRFLASMPRPAWAALALASMVFVLYVARPWSPGGSPSPPAGVSESTSDASSAPSGVSAPQAELPGAQATSLGFVTLETESARSREALETVMSDREFPDDARNALISNLEMLDRAIRESREALATDPNNSNLQRTLLTVYQKQIELLRWATRLVQAA